MQEMQGHVAGAAKPPKPKRHRGRRRGGENRGWTIGCQLGRHVARVLLPDGRYTSKSFDRAGEAALWAKNEAAKLLAGVTSAESLGLKATTERLTADYLANLKARGRSDSHLKECTHIFKGLKQATTDLGAPIADRHIESWLDNLTKTDRTPVSPATRNKYLVTVRGLCRWAMRRGLLVRDPTIAIDRASVPVYLKDQFTITELKAIVSPAFRLSKRVTPKQGRASPEAVRMSKTGRDPHWLLMCLLTYTGMRIDEALHVRWEDIDPVAGTVFISLDSGAKIKRRRERIIPLQAELTIILNAESGPRSGPIISGMEHNTRRIFDDYLARLGLPKRRRSPHSLRHTYAGIQTATGVPSILLAAHMGHTSMATTAEYAKMATRYLQETATWKRGEFRLLEGAASVWRSAPNCQHTASGNLPIPC